MANEWEHNHLRQTDEHIRAAKRYIYDQERLIERLAIEGKHTDDAFALLHLLTAALRLFESHRRVNLGSARPREMIDALILKRASTSRLSGVCNEDDYHVLADGVVVGRIFKADAAPVGMPWIWTMLFDYRWPTHGYEATREAAMAAFAKSWQRE
jgi:uncharacterized protein (DUF1778 family)